MHMHDVYTRLATELLNDDAKICLTGFLSVSSNMYIVEFAPARIRGKLACFGSVFVTGSIFLAALISGIFSNDKTNGWRSEDMVKLFQTGACWPTIYSMCRSPTRMGCIL